MKSLWLFFALWLILFAATAQTKNSPSGGGGAVIVGISHYKELDSLQFAHRDAAAFAEFLKTQNVPDDNIKLFLNEDATRFNIVDELYNLTQKLNKGDKFYFYFTGHGDLEAKIGYENSLLLLHGCYKKNYFQGTEYLQLSELRTWFGQLTKKGVEVVFIADACHSGGLIGGKEGLDKTQKALQESWAGITKILSSQANEFSLEGKQWGGGRGIFSYFLVNGFTGRADANKDKKVSLKELDNYLQTNVVREANPNVQTPVTQGNAKQILSQSSEAGLKKLAEAERLSFPIITEANLKAADPMSLIGGLDNSLVETYKKFEKALKEKRLNTFDNEKDYALLHYRKLASEKLPEHLLAIMKRNLGVGLLERELEILKEPREKGRGYITGFEKLLVPAISNLEEAMKLFGSSHYFYNFLQARKWVLEGALQSKISPTDAGEKVKQVIQEDRQRYKKHLLKALVAEPNMISTYALLSTQYKILESDSAIYYQEKVVQLLPNEPTVYLGLGGIYANTKYYDADNNPVPHPKAIQYLEKVIEMDSTIIQPYSMLSEYYMSGKVYNEQKPTSYHNYPKAIYYHKKYLSFHEISEQEILKIDFSKPNLPNDIQRKLGIQKNYYARLYFLYKATDNLPKAEEYLKKLHQTTEIVGSVSAYMGEVINMYELCYYDKNDTETYLKYSLDLLQKALKRTDEDLKGAAGEGKILLSLQYREVLKAIGATHRGIKNYAEADNILHQALAYPIINAPITLKLRTLAYLDHEGRFISVPFGVSKVGTVYLYNLDANIELFFLKLEQHKPEEAFIWLEKAFQNSVVEAGNYLSGQEFEKDIFKTYTALDQARFKTLKAKYFPLPDTKK